MNTLEAISPIDGRYRGKAEKLAAYFSESALIRNRVRVEIEYYIALMKELGVDGCNDAAAVTVSHVCLHTFAHTLPLPCSEYFLPALTSGYNSPLLFALASLQRVNHVPDTCLHKFCWHVP